MQRKTAREKAIECAQDAATARARAWRWLRRVGRYLRGTSQVTPKIQRFLGNGLYIGCKHWPVALRKIVAEFPGKVGEGVCGKLE